MRRALVVLGLIGVLGVVASSASARRVVHVPRIGELCPGGEAWSKIARCVARHGKVEVLRDEGTLKLIRIGQPSRVAGLVLYHRRTKAWQVTGELPLYQDYELLGFDRARYGKQAGVRADIGVVTATSFAHDGQSMVTGVLRQSLTWLCLDNLGCTEMITSCDGLVHGRALYTFRGKVVHEGRELKVIGDRRNASPYCAQREVVWSFD